MRKVKEQAEVVYSTKERKLSSAAHENIGNTAKVNLNQIVNGDCLDMLSTFPDNVIDLPVFSPPYAGIRDYKKNWPFDFRTLGKHLYRVTKDGGAAIVVIGDGTKNFAKSLTSFRLAVNWVDEGGWKLFENVIYKR